MASSAICTFAQLSIHCEALEQITEYWYKISWWSHDGAMESWRAFLWKIVLRVRMESDCEEETAVPHVYSRWHSDMAAMRVMVSHTIDGGISEVVLFNRMQKVLILKPGKFQFRVWKHFVFCNLMTFLNYGLPLKMYSLAGRHSMMNWVEKAIVCDTAICQVSWKCSCAPRILFAFKHNVQLLCVPSNGNRSLYCLSNVIKDG